MTRQAQLATPTETQRLPLQSLARSAVPTSSGHCLGPLHPHQAQRHPLQNVLLQLSLLLLLFSLLTLVLPLGLEVLVLPLLL